ncbi:MAG: molybdopterin-guanine dinucleotide biosynthesis protein [Euzebyaceae bacterium]|nr:molybdopterin-guanine dinucleotide biosynthesis protein [Euzebyaceae bacterium]
MDPENPQERFLSALAEEAGTPPVGADEAAAVLDLARVTAHLQQRRFAPLTTYALGLAIGTTDASADPLARVARIREVIAVVEGLDA